MIILQLHVTPRKALDNLTYSNMLELKELSLSIFLLNQMFLAMADNFPHTFLTSDYYLSFKSDFRKAISRDYHSGVILFLGLTRQSIIALILIGLASLPVGWFSLKDYQRDRVMTFLDPSRDPLGKGYHIIHSKVTIGSGGLLGKGFLSGTQTRLNFLPEQHTDFIFSSFAEEWGLIGSILLLAGSCKTTSRSKTLKPGKPIPCPQKDCY